jgi:hypothetical protein
VPLPKESFGEGSRVYSINCAGGLVSKGPEQLFHPKRREMFQFTSFHSLNSKKREQMMIAASN